MAERRTRRTTRQDDELPEEADDELLEETDDELPEEADDELPEETDDELSEEADDELPEEAEGEPESADGDESRRTGRRSSHGRRAGLSAAKAGQAGLRQIAELTGKEAEGVTGVEPADDGWVVGVEVVEDKRIPSSTDILATYETEVGMDGELVSYRRVKRYTRGRGDDGDA
jgi:gas vesicle protein GvpO